MTASRKNGASTGRQSSLRKRFSGAAQPQSGIPQTRPYSIRLTDSERTALKAAVGAKPIGAFVRERLLDDTAQRKLARRPSSDTALLGQILARLGRSGLASGLSDLGAAAKLGTVTFTPEMEAQLQAVCADIQAVKHMLVRGLGLAEERSR